MYGSVSLRKYTGPNQVWPGRAFLKAGSCERSSFAPAVSIFRRETASCSRPLGSICAMSVTAEPRARASGTRCAAAQGPRRRAAAEQRRRAAARSDSRTARAQAPRPFRAADRKRFLVLLVGEVQADAARNDERAAHQRQNQQEVLAEELPAVHALWRLDRAALLDDGLDQFQRLSSLRITFITSSAVYSTDGGTAMPRAFAVFVLITSSNFTGCSTGSSAGFAPEEAPSHTIARSARGR